MEVEGLWFSFLTSFIIKMPLTTAPRRWSKELRRFYSWLLFLEATWITKTKKNPIFHTSSKVLALPSLIHPLIGFPIPFNCSLNFPDTHLRFVSTWHLNSHALFWIFILYLYVFTYFLLLIIKLLIKTGHFNIVNMAHKISMIALLKKKKTN